MKKRTEEREIKVGRWMGGERQKMKSYNAKNI